MRQQLTQIAEQMINTVSRSIQAGKISPLAETKARVALTSIQIELTRAERELVVRPFNSLGIRTCNGVRVSVERYRKVNFQRICALT